VDPHRRNGYWRSTPVIIATAMNAAAIQSTTTQNGGHHRVLATNGWAMLPQVFEPVADEAGDD
jgi:hypothetical protein